MGILTPARIGMSPDTPSKLLQQTAKKNLVCWRIIRAESTDYQQTIEPNHPNRCKSWAR